MTLMSSKCKTCSIPDISLRVSADSLNSFTTLLQSGFFVSITQGESIGGLLASLPGFSEEYIKSRVQTIFMDGLPADNLKQQFSTTETVLAISAAMPGLAGAIFRKDGIHASLRTATAKESCPIADDQKLSVRLKLFNIIAIERGAAILAQGCLMQSISLQKFLDYRPPLDAAIQKININGKETERKTLRQILETNNRIVINIKSP